MMITLFLKLCITRLLCMLPIKIDNGQREHAKIKLINVDVDGDVTVFLQFKITVMISRARTVGRVHPGQLPISVNARAITRDQHVTHPSPQTTVTRLPV